MGEYTLGDMLSYKYAAYRERAKGKNRDFKLSFQEFKDLVLAPCAYCGLPAERGMKHKLYKAEFRLNGIDRVDNSKGYIPTNVVSCCTYCNFSKNDATLGEWVRQMRRIIKHVENLPLDAEKPDEDIRMMDNLARRMRNASVRVQSWKNMREKFRKKLNSY